MFHLNTVEPMHKLYLTPAQIWNARYNTNASVFVSAKDRIQQYFQAVPGSETELEHAIRDFKSKNPNQKLKDIKLARAALGKLSDIRIDDTMNRPLNWEHVLKILRNFKDTRILAINVYEDPEAPGCWIAWDGQHTTIVLYIIFCLIYDQSASQIEVPIVIASSNDKAAIRENFIILNTEESEGGGKVSLSPLDKFCQMVHGVRMDGNLNPIWQEAERKQKMLEEADLFLTSEQYQNTSQKGAITHVTEIIDETEQRVQNFCTYWKHRPAKRHVETKELVMINEFFRACDIAQIKITDKFIKDMATIFYNTFECEFTGLKGLNIFWRKLDNAYQIWYDATYPAPRNNQVDNRPTRYTMTKNGKHQLSYGVTFMIQLLQKHGFSYALPKPTDFDPSITFVARVEDLW